VDSSIVVWVATHRIGALNDLFVALGNVDRLGLLWVVVAIAIGLRRHSLAGALVLALIVAVVSFAADSASFGVKDIFQRARPFEASANA
jgi:hypothetical protein